MFDGNNIINNEKENLKREILNEFKKLSPENPEYNVTYFPNGEDVLLYEDGDQIKIIKFGMMGVDVLEDGTIDVNKSLFDKAVENIKAIINRRGYQGLVKRFSVNSSENGIIITDIIRKAEVL